MSYEKNQCNQGTKKSDFPKLQNNINNLNKLQDNNLLLKPIAIKQNILPNNQPNININKYPGVSVIYKNTPPPFLNDINPINYKSSKDSTDLINYNNEVQNLTNNDKGAFSSYPNYTNNNSSKINNIKNERGENCKIHCTCKKTKCIKKYCECFSRNVYCFNCKCENCENKSFFEENNNNMNNINNINNTNKIEEEIKDIKEKKEIKLNNENSNDTNTIPDNNQKKLIICTCSKSGCNKNYCECFKAKVKCNNKCRCIKCLNKPDDTLQLDEDKIITKSLSAPINNITNITNITNTNNTINLNNFTVHRISVNINKVQTLINTEKLDYFDSHKFLSKKRNET